MEGRLKTQNNNKSKNSNEPEQYGVSEIVFEIGEPMGMQAGMHQSITNVPYDSMPTNDPTMLSVTNMDQEMRPDQDFVPQIDLNLDQSFSWEMIGLGLEEPMPTQEAVDELYDLHPPVMDHTNKTKEHRSFSIRYIHLYQ